MPMLRSAQYSYARMSSRSGPRRDGLMFTIRGANGSPAMSATEGMFAAHVMRWRGGARAGGGGREVRRGPLGEAGARDPPRRDPPRGEPVQLGVGALVDDRADVEAL